MIEEATLGRLFSDRIELPRGGEALPSGSVPAHGGVCALTGDDGAIIQVLSTQSLRRTVIARLARGDEGQPRRRADVAGVARQLWWQPAHSTFESSWTYLKVARQLWPKSYRRQLGFGPSWCACIDLDVKWPRWTVREAPYGAGTIATGLFPTRAGSAAFVESLEDIFDLCREYEVLRRAPEGQRCAYFDMGKCPGPCDGTSSEAAYRESIDASIRFALGEERELSEQLRARMEEASQALAFESAQRCKEKLDAAERLAKRDARLMRSPRAERWIILQRGRTRSSVKPFFFAGGVIEAGTEVSRKHVREAAASWLAREWPSDNGEAIDANYRTECLWLVAHFLGKGDRAPGAYVRTSDAEGADALVELIEANVLGRKDAR